MNTIGFLGLGLLLGAPAAGGELFTVTTSCDTTLPARVQDARVQSVELADGTQQVCEVRPGEVRVYWRSGGGPSAENETPGIARRSTTSVPGGLTTTNSVVAGSTRFPAWTARSNLRTLQPAQLPNFGRGDLAGTIRSHGNGVGVARSPSSTSPQDLARLGRPNSSAFFGSGGGQSPARVRGFTTRRDDSAADGSLEGRVTDLERRVEALEREIDGKGAARSGQQPRVFGLPDGQRLPAVRVPAMKVPRIRVPRMEVQGFVLPEFEIEEFDVPEIVVPELEFSEVPGPDGAGRVIEWNQADGKATIVWPEGDTSSDPTAPPVLYLRRGVDRAPRVLHFHTDGDGATRVEVGGAESSEDGSRGARFEIRFDSDGVSEEYFDPFDEGDEGDEGLFETGEEPSYLWSAHEPADRAAWTSSGPSDPFGDPVAEPAGLADVEELVDELRVQVEDLRAGLGDLRRRIRAESAPPSAGGAEL